MLPERLDAEYVAEDGSKQRPVMLHRAICGSIERFIGVHDRELRRRLPAVAGAGAGGGRDDHLRRRRLRRRGGGRRCKAAGLRVETDLRNEKINYKVREHSLAKVPVIAVVGRREAEEGKVALRRLGSDGQPILSLEEAVAALTREATRLTGASEADRCALSARYRSNGDER